MHDKPLGQCILADRRAHAPVVQQHAAQVDRRGVAEQDGRPARRRKRRAGCRAKAGGRGSRRLVLDQNCYDRTPPRCLQARDNASRELAAPASAARTYVRAAGDLSVSASLL